MTEPQESMREPMNAQEGPAQAPNDLQNANIPRFWCCFTSMWSDRIVRLVNEAEEDDSRWSRWFSNGLLMPKEVSDRYRLSCAIILIMCCTAQTAVSIDLDGLDGLRINFSFLTVWGIYINMIYFCALTAYVLKLSPFSKPSQLRWISLLAQFALVVEVLIMILYFALIFTSDFSVHNKSIMFWFSLIFEHVACPLFVIVDFSFCTYSRSWIGSVYFLLNSNGRG